MGEKGFCFKHSKVISSTSSGCEDFAMKTNGDIKKRWIFEERDKRAGGARTEEITVVERPAGTEGFALPKKSKTKERIFIDSEAGEETMIQPKEGAYAQGENLFLAVLAVGLVVLIIILLTTGVF